MCHSAHRLKVIRGQAGIRQSALYCRARAVMKPVLYCKLLGYFNVICDPFHVLLWFNIDFLRDLPIVLVTDVCASKNLGYISFRGIDEVIRVLCRQRNDQITVSCRFQIKPTVFCTQLWKLHLICFKNKGEGVSFEHFMNLRKLPPEACALLRQKLCRNEIGGTRKMIWLISRDLTRSPFILQSRDSTSLYQQNGQELLNRELESCSPHSPPRYSPTLI